MPQRSVAGQAVERRNAAAGVAEDNEDNEDTEDDNEDNEGAGANGGADLTRRASIRVCLGSLDVGVTGWWCHWMLVALDDGVARRELGREHG